MRERETDTERDREAERDRIYWVTKKLRGWDTWVVQWLSICLWLRPWSRCPGIKSCVRLPSLQASPSAASLHAGGRGPGVASPVSAGRVCAHLHFVCWGLEDWLVRWQLLVFICTSVLLQKITLLNCCVAGVQREWYCLPPTMWAVSTLNSLANLEISKLPEVWALHCLKALKTKSHIIKHFSLSTTCLTYPNISDVIIQARVATSVFKKPRGAASLAGEDFYRQDSLPSHQAAVDEYCCPRQKPLEPLAQNVLCEKILALQ